MNVDMATAMLLDLLKKGDFNENSDALSAICLCWAANLEFSLMRDYVTDLKEERLKSGKKLTGAGAQDDIRSLQYNVLVQATVQNVWEEAIAECEKTIIRYKVSQSSSASYRQNVPITRRDIAQALLSLSIKEVKQVLVRIVNEWVWNKTAHELEQIAKNYGYYKPDWTPMAYIQLILWFLSWDFDELQWHTFTDKDVAYFRKCGED